MWHTVHRVKDRFAIVIFYTVIIAGALYSPRLISTFNKAQLNIYTFIDTISPEAIREFEELTGAQVNVKYYDNSDEFLAELQIRKGYGYDVVAPTDYIVETLRKEGLLMELDQSKISNMRYLDQRLQKKYFDPHNTYSVPYAWSVLGIGYDRKLFDEKPGWAALFEPSSIDLVPYHVLMSFDSPLELTFALAVYLSGKVDQIDDLIDKMKPILIAQRPYVESYSGGDRKYYLKAGIVSVVLTEAAVMKEIIKEDDRFAFALPKEGSILVIENLALSHACRNVELAHAFIDFMLSKRGAQLTWNYGWQPSNKEAYENIEPRFINDVNFFPDDATFKRLHLMHNEASLKAIERLWFQIRLAPNWQ